MYRFNSKITAIKRIYIKVPVLESFKIRFSIFNVVYEYFNDTVRMIPEDSNYVSTLKSSHVLVDVGNIVDLHAIVDDHAVSFRFEVEYNLFAGSMNESNVSLIARVDSYLYHSFTLVLVVEECL